MAHIKRLLQLISALCMLFVMATPTFAESYPDIDTTKTGSITITYAGEGAEFKLYHIADVSSNATFSLRDEYASYTEDNFNYSDEEWLKLAEELSEAMEGVTADVEGLVITDGTVTASDLALGLYLMVGRSVTIDKRTYHPLPTFVMVPAYIDDEWNYEVSAEPKQWTETISEPGEEVDYKVIKKWEKDTEDVRPTSVTVRIYRNTEVYKTVILDASNEWCYTWSDDDSNVTYSVTEVDIPEGYSLAVTGNETEFILTNVYQKPTPTPGTSTEGCPECVVPSPKPQGFWIVNTGDDTNIGLFAGVLAGSVTAAVIVLFLLSRTQRKD